MELQSVYLERELEVALQVAREAGELALTFLREHNNRVDQVEIKADGSVVTEIDGMLNSLIVDRLQEQFPDDAIIAEESMLQKKVGPNLRCWFVDPLDGTKEYITGSTHWSTMIGLCVDGEPHLGVCLAPGAIDNRSRCIYYGVKGQGSFIKKEDDHGVVSLTRLAMDAKTCLSADLCLIRSGSFKSSYMDIIKERLGWTRDVVYGSFGLKAVLLGEKVGDMYINVSGNSSCWDACAPDAILREAGGALYYLDTGTMAEYRHSTEYTNKRPMIFCATSLWPVIWQTLQGCPPPDFSLNKTRA